MHTQTSNLGIITSDEEIIKENDDDSYSKSVLIRKNLPSKIPILDIPSHPCSPGLYLQVEQHFGGKLGESYNQTGITKTSTRLKWVLSNWFLYKLIFPFTTLLYTFSSICRPSPPEHYLTSNFIIIFFLAIRRKVYLFLLKIHSFLCYQVYHSCYSICSQILANFPPQNQPRVVSP